MECRFFGTKSHSNVANLLRSRHKFYCQCHLPITTSTMSTTSSSNTMELSSIFLQFAQDHHLQLYFVEKKFTFERLTARIDAAFINSDDEHIYIIDWKFPIRGDVLRFDSVLQLNLYMYILKKSEPKYQNKKFKLYCIHNALMEEEQKTEIFSCPILDQQFINNFVIYFI